MMQSGRRIGLLSLECLLNFTLEEPILLLMDAFVVSIAIGCLHIYNRF